MKPPFLVLGTYHPPRWKSWVVGHDLTAMTKKAGLVPHVDPAHGPLLTVPWYDEKLHAEVRRRTFKTKQAEAWHYDGDITPGSKPECAIVTWSTNTPIEIQRNGESTIYSPKPYEVIIFHNKHVVHRRPPGCPRVRWVFRQRCAVPSWELP